MRKLLVILLLISGFAFAQTELLPVISWQTNVTNVEQLTDSTYRFSVFPLDWNEPGAAAIQYGRYFQDYAGNTYEVIDSAYLSVTVKDVFQFGVSPQVNQVGIMFEPPTDADYLAPIQYQKLDKIGLDNARARELAYLWKQANLYAKDSSYLVWWNDTIQDIATKYDIDTLTQKTLDSLLIHRTEIDQLKNQSDYYLLTTDFNDSMIVLRSEIPTLLTQLDSTGFEIKEAQISDLQPYLLKVDLSGIRDTTQQNADSIDVLANLINDIETITELADVLESQAGISDKLMTALRTAEQIELNAVPYYNVREDIYSNFDATFDSIFASNLYQENISVDATGTGGVYDKEVLTDNIEVFLNGVLQRENVHYIQTETQITFIMTPLSDDYVTIKYKR